MSKLKILLKALLNTIKLFFNLLIYLIKIIATFIPRFIRLLLHKISKRLRVSITFKTATTYSFILATIFFVLSIAIGLALGGFLLHTAQEGLEQNARVTQSFIKGTTIIPESRIISYAEIEDIQIFMLDEQDAIEFTTREGSVLPKETTWSKGRTILAHEMYITLKVPDHQSVKAIVVAKSLEQEIISLMLLMLGLIISFLLSVLFIVLRGSKTLRRMLRPIDDMIKTARSISANDFRTRLNVVDSHDELKDLAETFNEMLNRLQISYEQQTRFVSDASHELRTPIAVIQGYANLLQRWGKEDKAVLEEAIIAIKLEADNMKELVERLLFLARADKDTQKINKSRFSLKELIEELVKETKLIDSQHEIKCEQGEPVTLDADRGLIKQALRIFLDNSIKFTPKGGSIIIGCHARDNCVTVFVADDGVGIPSEDLPYVFNRFYKSDKSRTRGVGGTGLGLSIAKWIVEKHKGTINIESILNKGTKVIIKLPV